MRRSTAGSVLRSNIPRDFRREMAQQAVAARGVSVALACRAFGISRRCYRYLPLLADENEEIEDSLVALNNARKNWGFGLCYLYLRNVKGFRWNHKRVRRIYCGLELNLRIKPRKRLKRERPDPLSVPDQPNKVCSMPRPTGDCAAICRKGFHSGSAVEWKIVRGIEHHKRF